MLDISVIIPFKDHAEVTLKCVHSLHKFGEPVKEIILLSNNSSKAELDVIKSRMPDFPNAKLFIYDHPFNYQKINNFAVKHTSGQVILLLNNDIELTNKSRGLIMAMYENSLKVDTGAVGCVLLYGNKRDIQHAGIYLVPGGTADHLYARRKLSQIKKLIAKKQLSYDVSDGLQVSAVTGAALMVERKKFEKVNGMNENFIIGGGDVDLGLRLDDAGYKSWLVGYDHGFMLHKEMMSRSSISIPYVDFYESYKSYVEHFDIKEGDKYLHWEKVLKT